MILETYFFSCSNKVLRCLPGLVNLCFALILLSTSCRKMIKVDAPYTTTNAGNVFKEDGNAISSLTGIYTQMSSSAPFTGNNSISMFAGLSADELTLFSGVTTANFNAYYNNALIANEAQNYGSEFWSQLYGLVYICNAAIEGLEGSTSLTLSIKQQLLGEAKFLRGFYYFYLVNLFGDVPLVLTTDYKINASLARSSKDQTYQQIILDLDEAEDLLSDNYLGPTLLNTTLERVRPNKGAAKALLARVYLYGKNYLKAEELATDVINNTSLYSLLPALDKVFLKNSQEAIWQLQPVVSGRNTEDARTFILTTSGPTANTDRPVYLQAIWLKNFEDKDQRKIKWIDSVVATGSGIKYFFPGKYKNNTANVTEYLMMLRIGELYLIRAEARAQLDKIIESKEDVDAIRKRAGLGNAVANDKAALLNLILHERQVELFTEMGHRWLDLKRTGKVDDVMTVHTPLKSNGVVQWQSYQQLYPISFNDIQRGVNISQNPQYN